MRKHLLTLTLLIISTLAFAAPVTKEQALRNAQEFINRQPRHAQSRARLAHRQPVVGLANDATAYYVFNVGEKEGFVIVSGDDRTPAILGYADQGTFATDHLPDNMKAWLQGYADQISFLTTNRNVLPAPRVKSAARTDIEPLLTSLWNQDSPYNNLCPTDPATGERSVTGCVATAMAQVIYYHRYPERTTMQIPAYTTSSGNFTVPALNVTTLDWNNMVDVYQGGETSAQKTAVAQLMALCGASVEMDYSSASSGASDAAVAPALRKYFGYASSTRMADRNVYRTDAWDQLIYGELAAGRPVLYAGRSSGGGHEFVIDGYSTEGLFHVNWGWGGYSNGYFLLSILNSNSNDGIGASSSTDGYSFMQTAVVGMTPSEGVAENDIRMTTYGMSLTGNSTATRSDGAFTVSLSSAFYNMTGDTRTFHIGFSIFDSNDQEVESFYEGPAELESNWGWRSYQAEIAFGTNLPDGNYKLKPTSCDENDEHLKPDFGTESYYLGITISGDIATFREPSISLSGALATSGTPEVRMPMKLTATVTNNGTDFMDDIYLFVDDTMSGGTHLELNEGLTTTLEIEHIPETSGTKLLELRYWADGEWQTFASTNVTIGTTTDTKKLTYAITLPESVEEDIVTSSTVTAVYRITNSGPSGYNNTVAFTLYKSNGSRYSLEAYQQPNVTLAQGESKDVTVEFDGLEDNTDYVLGMQYISDNAYQDDAVYKYFTTDFSKAPVVTAIDSHAAAPADKATTVYNLNGQTVAATTSLQLGHTLQQLPKGVYVVNGRKYTRK